MPIPVLVSNPRRNTYHGLEDASQTWNEGDFVTLDATSGEVRLFDIDGDDSFILGLAQADASGTTGTDAPVSQIWPGDIIALDTYDSDAGAAKDASAYIPGKKYELIGIGTGDARRWYAEFSASYASGLACLICEGIVQDTLRKKLEGTTRVRALFRIIDSVLLQHVGQ